MERCTSPVFVVGSSKSGTTLVSACLNRHPGIHIARETHFFDDLRPRLVAKRRRDAACSITDEAVAYFQKIDKAPYGHGDVPAESTLDTEELIRLANEFGNTPDSYFEAYCTMKARAKNKPCWGEKTPRHAYRVADILRAYPESKIVFVIRDPRAVVASYRDWKTHGRFPDSHREVFERE